MSYPHSSSLRAHALHTHQFTLLNSVQLSFLCLKSMRLVLLLSAILQYCACNGFIIPAKSHTHSSKIARSAAAAASDPAMLEALVKCASEAARKAGSIMVERNGAPIIKSKANAKDLLTEVSDF
jgi:hypothetical protein